MFAYAFSGRDITGKSVEDMVYEAQRKVIREIAEKESCVIIGRNADFILCHFFFGLIHQTSALMLYLNLYFCFNFRQTLFTCIW